MPAAAQVEVSPRPLQKGDHVFLLDGSSYVFRAYFAMFKAAQARGRSFTRSDGLPTGAVLTFSNMLWKLLREGLNDVKPTHIAVVFDHPAKTFRNEIYSDYKGHRPDPPDELKPQFPLMREAVRAFGLIPIEQEGYEADDLIASYAREALEAGADVTIVAGDKDMMQLIRPGITMYDPMPGNERRIGPQEVVEKFGVPPEKVPDVQALIGDTTDNVPGVPGIGPKAAATLITEFGSVESLLNDPQGLEDELRKLIANLQTEIDALAGEPVKASSAADVARILQQKFNIIDLPGDKKGRPSADSESLERLANEGQPLCRLIVRIRNLSRLAGASAQKLVEFAEQARMSKRLVILDDRVTLVCPLDQLCLDGAACLEGGDARELVAFLKAMEFTTLTKRVAEALGIEAAEISPNARLAAEGIAPPDDEMEFVEVEREPLPATSAAQPSLFPSPQRPIRPGAQSLSRQFTPAELVAARMAQATSEPIDRSRYVVVNDVSLLDVWISKAIDLGTVAVDIVSTSPDPMIAEIVGISLALGASEACYIPLSHRAGDDLLSGGGRAEGQIAEREALKRLKPLFEDRGVLKVAHDIKPDLLLLARHDIELKAFDDVMLMSYVLDAGRTPQSLEALAGHHLGHTTINVSEIAGKGRTLVPFQKIEVVQACPYCAEIPDVTLRLWRVLKARLVAEGLATVYETLERPLPPVLARMERCGISIDRAMLARLSADFAQTTARLEDEIAELAGERFNLGSPKQLGDILFGKMGLPGATKTPTGAWSTRANVLEELAEEQGVEIARKILEWRQISKLKSTYTDALPSYVNPDTGRVHTSYALAATTTGRLSSSEPNLQNIPIRREDGRKIRKAFVAPPGYKLVSADYSQIELRLLAEIAEVPALRQAFRDGTDIHAMTASEMFGVPVQGMSSDVRRRAKAINFGIIYGISAFGLANQLGIGREEAGAYIKKYFERFPGIRDYMEATKTFCRANGYVTTLLGRKMHYPDIRAKNPAVRSFNERAAINARLQGTAADIIRRAMVRVDPALAKAKLSARMLLQVHDELVFEVPEAEVAATLPVVEKVMADAPMPALHLQVPLQVEARAASNWDEAH